MRTLWYAAPAICCCALASIVAAQPAPNVPPLSVTNIAAIKSIYSRLLQIEIRNDYEAELIFLKNHTADNWMSIDDWGQTHSRTELIQFTEAVAAGRASSAVPPGSSIRLVQIVSEGNTAIVKCEMRLPTLEWINDNYSLHEVRVVTSRDTWTKTQQGWRWTLREVSTPHYFVNQQA